MSEENEVPIELKLSDDRSRVLIVLPSLPLVEWDGVPVTGVSLTVGAAHALAVQLIRWAIIAEDHS
jgi:hypothetical protein